MPKIALRSFVLPCLAAVLIGCGSKTAQPKPTASSPPETPTTNSALHSFPMAVAHLHFNGLENASGKVVFTQTDRGTQIVVDITGISPGLHGIHIHEKGDCSTPDFSSAGGHFNPSGTAHGGPDSEVHHAGDLGNIEIGPDGIGHLELTSRILTVEEGPDCVVGRAVIVHAGPDNLISQPSGDSGPRIACGLVRLELTIPEAELLE
ncbi:MAG: superoxide dismutase family protein [Acidobacteriota bacterium]